MANQIQKSDSPAPMIIPVALFGFFAFMAVRKSKRARKFGLGGAYWEHKRMAELHMAPIRNLIHEAREAKGHARDAKLKHIEHLLALLDENTRWLSPSDQQDANMLWDDYLEERKSDAGL